jgi:EAL domain-containing protein (putative c-di-GMP-specific phosphodiesterase class I)
MHDRAAAARHMEMLRVAGIRFSIDDFGTGHSSLSLLQALPVDELKIDKQFVADLETNADSAKIVQSTVDLARALGLKVVAEGIETESIWGVLAGFGCHLAQGYLISKPLPAEKFVAFVLSTNAPAVATDETQQMELSLMRVVR